MFFLTPNIFFHLYVLYTFFCSSLWHSRIQDNEWKIWYFCSFYDLLWFLFLEFNAMWNDKSLIIRIRTQWCDFELKFWGCLRNGLRMRWDEKLSFCPGNQVKLGFHSSTLTFYLNSNLVRWLNKSNDLSHLLYS